MTGPIASGLGAVQQFFEALGLAKPPRLQIHEQEIKLAGTPGTALSHILEVTSPDNKPIFVHAHCDQPWLFVGPVQLKGARANIPLEIQAVPDQPDTVLSAKVIVVGNGNQRFDITVSLDVTAQRPATTALRQDLAEESEGQNKLGLNAEDNSSESCESSRTPQ